MGRLQGFVFLNFQFLFSNIFNHKHAWGFRIDNLPLMKLQSYGQVIQNVKIQYLAGSLLIPGSKPCSLHESKLNNRPTLVPNPLAVSARFLSFITMVVIKRNQMHPVDMVYNGFQISLKKPNKCLEPPSSRPCYKSKKKFPPRTWPLPKNKMECLHKMVFHFSKTPTFQFSIFFISTGYHK